MGRRIQPNAEGHLFFVEVDGELYGPYAERAHAQNAGSNMASAIYWQKKYRARYATRTGYDAEVDVKWPKVTVKKGRLGPLEDAPYETLRQKVDRLTRELAELRAQN